jgi:hypothetical protein
MMVFGFDGPQKWAKKQGENLSLLAYPKGQMPQSKI